MINKHAADEAANVCDAFATGAASEDVEASAEINAAPNASNDDEVDDDPF